MIGEALNAVYSKFKLNFYRRVFQTFENREASLTTIETFFVELIYALNGPTVNELSRFTGMSQPNVAYKITNLEKKGYVKRIRSKEDKREVHLEVTEKFQKYYGINYEYLQIVSQRIMDRFPQEDVEKLKEMLEIVSDELMEEVTARLERKPKLSI
ncbi:MarR family winged helix-turn-helix transcriptional regulator [Filifactor villosus]|uniref:MarR family winged helix-turn-helix transcriptional regulator n=1 Tax=Filifactor villosus TaxID=29374 RepID=A0ABV9QNU2_9FIRM